MRIAHEGHSDYIFDGVTGKLKEVAEGRDLGIVVSNNLKPSLQCAKAVQCSEGNAGFRDFSNQYER